VLDLQQEVGVLGGVREEVQDGGQRDQPLHRHRRPSSPSLLSPSSSNGVVCASGGGDWMTPVSHDS
jgi:hypothetical protein